ncbi:HNH endonuclease signature motif containing protein [Sphingomonas sp.]|jgi:putative restriction endonuclease|uniref:HNH endonuclease signature motif containing protein n=1 Tax=Sphingomonas sp. TaxID=28214 RepID=UPI002EDB1364
MGINERSMQFLLADALRAYTQDFLLLSATNPYLVLVNGQRYSVHASEIHFAARANADEWRIQVPRATINLQRQRQTVGDIPLFIGFFPKDGVFAGWEPEYVLSLQPQDYVTVYVPLSDGEKAAQSQAAIDIAPALKLQRKTTKVSLRSEFLGVYLENWRALHASKSAAELRSAISQVSAFVAADGLSGTKQFEVTLGDARRLIVSTRTAFARNPAFRDAVMQAYGGACCVCGRQLGLVQAAHIVPHSHANCIDSVSNGLALCVEHHRLYDDALLLPITGGKLHLNHARVEHLKNIGQATGLDAIASLAANQYKVPDHAPSRPDDGFLEKGFRIRLGIDA